MKKAVKYQNIGLWVIQVGVGLLFAFSGAVNFFDSIQELAEQIVWPRDVPIWFTRFIGISEVLGGLGLSCRWRLDSKRDSLHGLLWVY